jgi:hypothetical protein
MTLHPIPLNFHIYEENFLFFLITAGQKAEPRHFSAQCMLCGPVARSGGRVGLYISRALSLRHYGNKHPTHSHKTIETPQIIETGYYRHICLVPKCFFSAALF